MADVIRSDSETHLGEGDYVMADDAAWFTVKEHFSVWIRTTEDGIVIDVFGRGVEGQDPIATTYAFDEDALAAQQREEE